MDNKSKSVNLRLLVGQVAIILLVIGGMGASYLAYSMKPHNSPVGLVLWTSVFIPLGIWTRYDPKKAFLASLIFYLTSVIIKDILVGGEYILPLLIHIYFTISMLIGIISTNKNGR